MNPDVRKKLNRAIVVGNVVAMRYDARSQWDHSKALDYLQKWGKLNIFKENASIGRYRGEGGNERIIKINSKIHDDDGGGKPRTIEDAIIL